MTYSIMEKGSQLEPIELYRFDFDSTLWLITSSDIDQTYLGDTYESTYVKRGGFVNGGDGNKSSVDMEVPSSSSIVQVFRDGWLHAPMILTIYRHHYNDADYIAIWKGRVTNCTWKGETSILTSESLITIFGRAGLRRDYSLGCGYPLYDQLTCRVNKEEFEHVGVIEEVNRSSFDMFSILAYGDNFYTGGMVKFGSEWRMLVNHNGTTLSMLSPIDGMKNGDTVSIWPGCDRSLETCHYKFNNGLNYGGFPYSPPTNPFKGDSLV